tara:strand:- start:98889 stop:100664 length:1776 start_codon:yes stop_codon:yes gene_type:complete
MNKVLAIVEKDKCHPNKCQHECMKFDPLNRAKPDSGFHLGESGKAEIAKEVVTEMHKISANKCPFSAINIVKLPEKLGEEALTHRFGANSFELYGLPFIKQNIVVGILGRNGIGKSTAFKILTGELEQNLGNYKEGEKEEAVLEKYKRTLYSDYFTKLFKKELNLSYKPQRIDLLPEAYKGTVKELLEKADERKIAQALLQALHMENLQDHDIEKLSGGELQKVAIIAALSKDFDVLYLDEPASFLDITSRIQVAKLIRKYCENRSVLVIEHDLSFLDYISDEIQIVYGEPAAYGAFSQPQGVRVGLNEYIDGYIKSINMQFREYKINFDKTHIDKKVLPETMAAFPEITKSYPNFSLKVNKGELKKGEVLAIMGANGLGKTTFLKLLAGEEKPDEGKVEKLKIAYKEQYPKAGEEKVKDYLQRIAGKNYHLGWYKQNILEKLGIQNYLESHMNHISGGELQKVYIAAALSTEAEVIALDEPSAFIDVEDRLKVAEVIKEFTEKKEVSTIVVDHDVQFIDYLGDQMLVFEGESGKRGEVYGPCSKEEGMNRVLKMLDITYRKDKDSKIARINKPHSQLDKEQKGKGKYYYN